MRSFPLVLSAVFLVGFPTLAYEGKWTPEQVTQLGDKKLTQLGLKLPAKRLWDPEKGKGLLAAAISVGGCSAAFISKEGLLVTNHHCLFTILQQHSGPTRDLIRDGFLAADRAAELPGRTEKVRIPRRFTDVTAAMLAAIPPDADDLARFRALERKGKELVAECEQRPATRCQLASFDGGLYYTLVDTLELSDVRLVYAPPLAVGSYGGEVDNWMWPRHTGDFAIARAYAAPDGSAKSYDASNVPWQPEFYLPLSKQGVGPNDFVMVLGYPGRTFRSLIAPEVRLYEQLFFPLRRDWYSEWIAILELATANDAAGKILVADDLKSLANRRKNAQGQLAGFQRGNITQRRSDADQTVLAFAEKSKEHAGAAEAYRALERLMEAERDGVPRDFLIDHLQPFGATPVSKALFLSTTLARAAVERKKPDLERDPSYMDRNKGRLKDALEREQLRYHAASDRAATLSLLKKALSLSGATRIAAIDKAFGGSKDVAATLDKMLAASKVLNLAERQKMFEETEEQLRSRKDPLLELGFALAEDVAGRVERKDRLEGAVSRLRPPWRRALTAQAGRPVDPDANSTLRVSFAQVKGYSPADAVVFQPQTTLQGMLAKETGQAPFEVPAKVRQAAAAKRYGAWKDARLGDVPVAFLADADTTGGNSGSPMVNARGELVGVNFDRVWENVANDFGYNAEVGRNISADVRYLWWMLDQVEGAQGLLKELGVEGPKTRP